jgi:hypothetical protein
MDNERKDNLRALMQAWKDEFGDVLTEDEARAELTRVANFYRTLGELIAKKRNDEKNDWAA